MMRPNAMAFTLSRRCATLAAYELALKDGLVKKTETAILYNCATGLKYPMPTATKKLNRHDAINYEAMQ